MKRIIFVLISICTGLVFLYSAGSKSLPIETFEYTMVDYLRLPWLVAAVLARLFVGAEAALGALLLANLYGKGKWVLRMCFFMLLSFSGYLFFLLVRFGNHVNCGCFGDAIWMSPTASLIKNTALLAIVAALYAFHRGFTFRYATPAMAAALLIWFGLPFLLFGLPSRSPDWLKQKGYTIDMSALRVDTNLLRLAPNPAQGKHIVAFLSPQCPHCRIAAYKMHLLHQSNPELPFFLVIGGSRDLSEFWQATQAKDLPFARLDALPFMRTVGGEIPMIVWLNNSEVEAKCDYTQLDGQAIGRWLAQK